MAGKHPEGPEQSGAFLQIHGATSGLSPGVHGERHVRPCRKGPAAGIGPSRSARLPGSDSGLLYDLSQMTKLLKTGHDDATCFLGTL